MVEQPQSSLFFDYPVVRDTLAKHGAIRTGFDMGCYGGLTVKPTTLGPHFQVFVDICGQTCIRLLYTSDASDELTRVDIGWRT